jgi:hypothetical protein
METRGDEVSRLQFECPREVLQRARDDGRLEALSISSRRPENLTNRDQT